ncbi:MAG: hypothetical protein EPO21_01795 [Chloroflexota bacterium]|nr:MAG: hypothetical protein EPO21_01795 [Chloroflexota bacterium]
MQQQRWEHTVYPIHIGMSGLKPLEIEKVIREVLRDAASSRWELITVQTLVGAQGVTSTIFLFFKRAVAA